jgi:hypothetical protein
MGTPPGCNQYRLICLSLQMTFAEKILEFNRRLNYTGNLPEGIQIMNPFRDNAQVDYITKAFYTRFFSDNFPRTMILGINPGRLGAGATGIPFTDTIRLNEQCGIPFGGFRTYEPSSSFVYDMIEAYGGVNDFYKKFFISAICPLGFTRTNSRGKTVNYNYYDNKALTRMVYGFILESLKKQLDFGIETRCCFCLGTGRNVAFLREMNDEYHFFERVVALEHPRFIMQYKARLKPSYIDKYLDILNDLN